jgi:hypothetical protein
MHLGLARRLSDYRQTSRKFYGHPSKKPTLTNSIWTIFKERMGWGRLETCDDTFAVVADEYGHLAQTSNVAASLSRL